jgi:hypothetical protein
VTSSRNLVAPDVTRSNAKQKKQTKSERFHLSSPRSVSHGPTYGGTGTFGNQEHLVMQRTIRHEKPPQGWLSGGSTQYCAAATTNKGTILV